MTLMCDQQPKVPLRHPRGGFRGGVQGVRTPPPDVLWLSNMTSILRRKKKNHLWFIGVEVKQAAILIM